MDLYYIVSCIFEDYFISLCSTCLVTVLFPSEIDVRPLGVFIAALVFTCIKYISLLITYVTVCNGMYSVSYLSLGIAVLPIIGYCFPEVFFTAGIVGSVIIVVFNFTVNNYFMESLGNKK